MHMLLTLRCTSLLGYQATKIHMALAADAICFRRHRSGRLGKNQSDSHVVSAAIYQGLVAGVVGHAIGLNSHLQAPVHTHSHTA